MLQVFCSAVSYPSNVSITVNIDALKKLLHLMVRKLANVKSEEDQKGLDGHREGGREQRQAEPRFR